MLNDFRWIEWNVEKVQKHGCTVAEVECVVNHPPRGVVLFAPCGFNSLNKLAHGIADTLALSVVAEAIGRGTPVIVGPSLNQPLLDHPMARTSLRTLPTWGVTIVPPVDDGSGATTNTGIARGKMLLSVATVANGVTG